MPMKTALTTTVFVLIQTAKKVNMVTLKSLPSVTAQEVFDQVKNHLLRQGDKARSDVNPKWGSAYKNKQGKVCAVGCLMAEDEYCPSFEGKYWYELVLEDLAPSTHFDLISSLQSIHDNLPASLWERALKSLAEKEKLNYENTGERV